eukprot:1008910-Amphidinium_carterae.1
MSYFSSRQLHAHPSKHSNCVVIILAQYSRSVAGPSGIILAVIATSSLSLSLSLSLGSYNGSHMRSHSVHDCSTKLIGRPLNSQTLLPCRN